MLTRLAAITGVVLNPVTALLGCLDGGGTEIGI